MESGVQDFAGVDSTAVNHSRTSIGGETILPELEL
jgi:hypothetical protein